MQRGSRAHGRRLCLGRLRAKVDGHGDGPELIRVGIDHRSAPAAVLARQLRRPGSLSDEPRLQVVVPGGRYARDRLGRLLQGRSGREQDAWATLTAFHRWHLRFVVWGVGIVG